MFQFASSVADQIPFGENAEDADISIPDNLDGEMCPDLAEIAPNLPFNQIRQQILNALSGKQCTPYL